MPEIHHPRVKPTEARNGRFDEARDILALGHRAADRHTPELLRRRHSLLARRKHSQRIAVGGEATGDPGTDSPPRRGDDRDAAHVSSDSCRV